MPERAIARRNWNECAGACTSRGFSLLVLSYLPRRWCLLLYIDIHSSLSGASYRRTWQVEVGADVSCTSRRNSRHRPASHQAPPSSNTLQHYYPQDGGSCCTQETPCQEFIHQVYHCLHRHKADIQRSTRRSLTPPSLCPDFQIPDIDALSRWPIVPLPENLHNTCVRSSYTYIPVV